MLLCSCHLSYPFMTEKGATRSAARKLLKMNCKARNEKRPTSTGLYNWNYITWIIYNVKGHRSMDAFQIVAIAIHPVGRV